jgi:hypothetical protein
MARNTIPVSADDGIGVHGATRGDIARDERKNGKHRGDAGYVAESFGATG